MTEKIDVVDALAGLAEDLRSHGNFVDRISDAVAAMKKERDAAIAEIQRLRGLKAELPPRPGDIDDTIVNLPRYGLRWNGPTEPISVPMDDGYWTPWHLAQAQIQQAVDAFHDASRLRSLIQQARIKSENERDEARAEVERLRALRAESDRVLGSGVVVSTEKYAELVRAAGPNVSFLDELRLANERAETAKRERDEAAAAFQRGAEAMREAAMAACNPMLRSMVSRAEITEAIRNLPIPEDAR
jgi:hypothetical protein